MSLYRSCHFMRSVYYSVYTTVCILQCAEVYWKQTYVHGKDTKKHRYNESIHGKNTKNLKWMKMKKKRIIHILPISPQFSIWAKIDTIITEWSSSLIFYEELYLRNIPKTAKQIKQHVTIEEKKIHKYNHCQVSSPLFNLSNCK